MSDRTRWAFLDTETGEWIEVKPEARLAIAASLLTEEDVARALADPAVVDAATDEWLSSMKAERPMRLGVEASAILAALGESHDPR